MDPNLIEKVKEVIRTTNINYSPYYHVLPELINARGYTQGIELGVFTAGNILSILNNTKAKLVIGVDPYKEYPAGALSMGTIESQEEFDCLYDLVIQSLDQGRNHLIRESSDLAFKFYFYNSECDFDWVFIDAMHTYENCKRDLENYSQLIRKGGLVCVHDWLHGSFPGVTKAIQEFSEEHNAPIIPREFYFAYMEKTW